MRSAIFAVLSMVSLPVLAAPRRDVTVWLPYWSMDKAYQSVLVGADVIGAASTVWYQISSTGNVVSFPGAGSPAIIAGLRSKKIRIIPTVTTRMTSQDLRDVAFSDERRRAHASALIKIAASGDYDGLDLDYETIAVSDEKTAILTQPAFTALVRAVCAALHDAGKVCSVSVMPRSSDSSAAVWWETLRPFVYDYEAIGAAADRVRLMAYDEHTPRSGAGPVASLKWVEAIARYASSKISPGKIELGVPMYGRDWGGKKVKTLIYSTAEAARLHSGAKREWDATAMAPYFRYSELGKRHIAWYNDAQSAAARYELARKFKFAGVAFWAASQEDPNVWAFLRRSQAKD